MKIIIDRQRVFARHGVLPQEREVGAYFYVSATAETGDNPGMLSDQLCDTVSYADMAQCISEQMAQPSRLLEHVAWRIATAMLQRFASVQSVTVRVMKENPPMGVECRGAGVEITLDK